MERREGGGEGGRTGGGGTTAVSCFYFVSGCTVALPRLPFNGLWWSLEIRRGEESGARGGGWCYTVSALFVLFPLLLLPCRYRGPLFLRASYRASYVEIRRGEGMSGGSYGSLRRVNLVRGIWKRQGR